ncbi:hypothetical protein FRB94_011740 [Tulasnella sp. JGI-2019a]|nr:hypothetical protein FRB94_011740 [Tulasnella sp. JGI-2019a]
MVQLQDIDAGPDPGLASTPGNSSSVVVANSTTYLTEETHSSPDYAGVVQGKDSLADRDDESDTAIEVPARHALGSEPVTQYGPPNTRLMDIDTPPRVGSNDAELDAKAKDLSTEAIKTLTSHTTGDHFGLPQFNGYDAWPSESAPDGPVAGAASESAAQTFEDEDSDDDDIPYVLANEANPTSNTMPGNYDVSSHTYNISDFDSAFPPFADFDTPPHDSPGLYPDIVPITPPQDVHLNSQGMMSTGLHATKPESSTIMSDDQTANRSADIDHGHRRHGRTEPQQAEKYRMDLLPSIKGLFRLLDLYSEQGSGGLVDKIIIAQDSLKSLINALSPGAYTSITKIDFSALDQVSIKAVGLYGSKSELVRVFRETGAVEEETANLLLLSDDDRKASQYSLRSGIYLLDPSFGTYDPTTDPPLTVHIIYWPEDTTWDDTAAAGVKRNRVTFMRYLTRLTDQIHALVSPEHAATLVCNQDDSDSDDEEETGAASESDSDGESDDRFFTFEVAKTHEQEEDAQIHAGFILKHHAIGARGHFNGIAGSTAPRPTSSVTLVAGETRQGFMITSAIPGRDERQSIRDTYTRVRLVSLLTSKRVYLDQSIDDDALHVLLTDGNLSSRIPGLYKEYRENAAKLAERHASQVHEAKEHISDEIRANRSLLRQGIRWQIHDAIRASYSMLDLDPTNGGNQTEHEALESGHDYLVKLCNAIPDVRLVCDNVWREGELAKIDSHEYKLLKKRFTHAQIVLDRKVGALGEEHCEALIRSIISGFDPMAPPDEIDHGGVLKQMHRAFSKTVMSMIRGTTATEEEEEREKQEQQIRRAACTKPDNEFLHTLAECVTKDPRLFQASEALYKLAHEWAIGRTHDISRMASKVEGLQRRSKEEQVKILLKNQDMEDRKSALLRFRESLNAALAPKGSRPDIVLTHIRRSPGRYSSDIIVKGYSNIRSQPLVRHLIWPIELTGEDITALRANSRHIPRPRARHQPIEFLLPHDHRVRHVQLLRSERYLVVADTPVGTSIWLQSQIKPFPPKPTKQLPLLRHNVLAVDESKRLVTFINTDGGRCTLHVFVMDETLSNLSGRGTPFDVAKWYRDGPALIRRAVFFPGAEELCLIESSGRARIYSFLSQGFR